MRLRLLILLLFSLTFAGQALAEPFVDVFRRMVEGARHRQLCVTANLLYSGLHGVRRDDTAPVLFVRRGCGRARRVLVQNPSLVRAGERLYLLPDRLDAGLAGFLCPCGYPDAPASPLDHAGSASGSSATLRRSGADARHAQCEGKLSADRTGGGQRLVDGHRLDNPRGAGRLNDGACGGVRRMAPIQDRVALRNTGFLGAGDQERLDMTQTVQPYVFGLSYQF